MLRSRHHVAVAFDGDRAFQKPEVLDQTAHREGFWNFSPLAVHGQTHDV